MNWYARCLAGKNLLFRCEGTEVEYGGRAYLQTPLQLIPLSFLILPSLPPDCHWLGIWPLQKHNVSLVPESS
jgi:hypothetical protein